MKNFSCDFLSYASKKQIFGRFDFPEIENMSFEEKRKFDDLRYAFFLGVRFREVFSNSPKKVKNDLCSGFPISDIYE